MKKEIHTIEEIRSLVDSFYAKVREDDLLSCIFDGVIQDRWPEHLEIMYRFWQTLLLDAHTYSGSPFAPHARLPLQAVHFERWLLLFEQTVDEQFTGERAQEAKWRAQKMAAMFAHRIRDMS